MFKNLQNKYALLAVIYLLMHTAYFAQAFTWMKGDNLSGQSGTYGAMGVASALTNPGARELSASWTDAAGNLWLFGGYGFDSFGNQFLLSDLWKYSPLTNQWMWVNGDMTVNMNGVYGTLGVPSVSNNPGAREGAITWKDAAGNLWLFGGITNAGEINDLWKYNINTNEWTWVNGSNVALTGAIYGTIGVSAPGNMPGPRAFSVSWVDAVGNLCLFGGEGYDAASVPGSLNDIWKYNITTNEWMWVRGSNNSGQNGSYGALGIPAAANEPGTRFFCSKWQDVAGNIWIFGGLGYDATNNADNLLNDLWKYNVTTDQWTWMGGATAADQSGVYGTQGVPASGNIPGSRLGSAAWADAMGNFYLFGGFGIDANSTQEALNDFWRYSAATDEWTWVRGSNAVLQNGMYGILGQPSQNSMPGSRGSSVYWSDVSGNFWLFGGAGVDAVAGYDDLNDLWRYNTCTVGLTLNVSSSGSVSCPGASVVLTASGATTYSWLTNQTGSVISVSPGVTTNYSVIGTDAFGCRDTASYVQMVGLCTGINEGAVSMEKYQLYPNPSHGWLTISGPGYAGKEQLEIYNALGQKVFEEVLESRQVSLQLPKGVYQYAITGDNKRVNGGKLVID